MKNLVFLLGFLLSIIPLLTPSVEAYASSGHRKWSEYDLPIHYEINENGAHDCEGEFGAIHQAFETWAEISTSCIEFNDAPNTSRMPDTGHLTNLIFSLYLSYTAVF